MAVVARAFSDFDDYLRDAAERIFSILATHCKQLKDVHVPYATVSSGVLETL